ncbi:Dihydropteroate synthase [Pseudidiomarina planktonica]|uniref:Dihydropteroate synthase n=1 Tax=Pseudidiomarina planktonica TaxID=1323738 RepID=A0A1Y6EMI4_9GAMM|nr:dihydropteroate synthase [Pseudidiomarina planktonica]RUO65674.1 dihydropteroate synthase [Pseudidiomarina planktonica]SMQ63606.1 Dihydropteroate synthase [Pseudidiomarina planktonica]
MSYPTPNIEVMGIMNVTPDSFSDGGRFMQLDKAMQQAGEMVAAGASYIDIGGESTRPGADAVSEQEELDRVIPVIERVAAELAVKISVDTSKAAVMREAVNAGAHMINDVNALRAEGALAAAAAGKADVCLMHMQGEPRTMQHEPRYDDVVCDVKAFLKKRVQACNEAGIDSSRLYLDPGFGFGKSVRHNYQMLQRLQAFHELELPLLIGISRKSMLGAVTGRDVAERLPASIAAATIAALKGARIIRVHDVRETVDAMAVVMATQTGENL